MTGHPERGVGVASGQGPSWSPNPSTPGLLQPREPALTTLKPPCLGRAVCQQSPVPHGLSSCSRYSRLHSSCPQVGARLPKAPGHFSLGSDTETYRAYHPGPNRNAHTNLYNN